MINERVIPIVGGKVFEKPFYWMLKKLITPVGAYLGENPFSYEDKVIEDGQEFNIHMFYVCDNTGAHLYYVAKTLNKGVVEDIVRENLYFDGKMVKEEINISELDDNVVKFNWDEVLQFACRVAEDNKYLCSAMFASNIPSKACSVKAYKNIYELCVRYQGLFESYLKTNTRLLVSSLGGDIDFGKSIKDTFGIPQKAIGILEKAGMTDAIVDLGLLSEVGVNGNDITLIAEFLYKLRKLQGTTKQKRNALSHDFLVEFIPLIKAGHKVSQTLSYIIRQTYYYKFISNWDSFIAICRHLRDYDNMRIASGIDMEKYPQNLISSERLLVYNSQSLAEDLVEPFKAAVESYKKYAIPVSIKIADSAGKKVEKKYVVIAPSSPQDLVAEGSALMHCVGTYGKLVAEGRSKILFLRHAETPNESLITFEFDEGKVIHAAGMQNADPDEEQKLALKAWERAYKKI